MNKRFYPYIVTGLVSLLLSFKYFSSFDLFFDDKEIFKYTGFLVNKGLVPYKDFFDHKPPLIFFLNYAARCFGSNGLWLLDTCLVLFASIIFLKVNLRYKVYLPSALPILFNLMLRNSHISFGYGMTREYTTICLLLIFCVVIMHYRYKYILVGLLCALIFFMQQDQLILALPFFLYAIVAGKKSILLRNLLHLFAGGMIVAAPIVLYFFLNDALNSFWQDAFLFNFNWYASPEQKPSLMQELILLKNKLHEFNLGMPFLITCVLALASFFAGSKAKWLLIAAVSCIPLSFISEFLSGKMASNEALVNYYLLPLAATLPMALFVMFAFTKKNFFKHKLQQWVYACLLLFGPLLAIAEQTANFHRYPQDYINSSPEIKYLDKAPPADYQLYVFNNSNYIFAYNKYKIIAPSRWLYHYFWTWYPQWDADHSITNSIIDDLRKHDTKYIIIDYKETDVAGKINLQIWKAFIDSNYQQVYPLKLWQRK